MPPKSDRPRQLTLDFPARPEFTFANFIVSKDSRFARDAALRICAETEKTFHSLYITGESGFGKTHLLLAIGNEVSSKSRGKKNVAFVACPDFVAQVKAGHETVVAEMADRLSQVDFFLMDDVDAISGHPAAQEKLYLIFNSLMQDGKKIVFAGATRPADLAGTGDFLRSRLQWGVTAELHPLDENGMRQVFKNLSAGHGLAVPDSVITYLFHRIPRDYNSISNAVRLINRESFEQKKKVTLPLVKTALRLSA